MWKSPVARWHLVNRNKTAEKVKKTREQQVPVLRSVDIQKPAKSAQQATAMSSLARHTRWCGNSMKAMGVTNHFLMRLKACSTS